MGAAWKVILELENVMPSRMSWSYFGSTKQLHFKFRETLYLNFKQSQIVPKYGRQTMVWILDGAADVRLLSLLLSSLISSSPVTSHQHCHPHIQAVCNCLDSSITSSVPSVPIIIIIIIVVVVIRHSSFAHWEDCPPHRHHHEHNTIVLLDWHHSHGRRQTPSMTLSDRR
jgi:hypothetical protein